MKKLGLLLACFLLLPQTAHAGAGEFLKTGFSALWSAAKAAKTALLGGKAGSFAQKLAAFDDCWFCDVFRNIFDVCNTIIKGICEMSINYE